MKNSFPLHGLYYRADGFEDPQDLLCSGSVVRGVGFQQGEGRAEGDSSRHPHARTDACLGRSLRNLPNLSALSQVTWSKEGNRGRIQFRSTDQLEPKLEGGKPEAERRVRGKSGHGRDRGGGYGPWELKMPNKYRKPKIRRICWIKQERRQPLLVPPLSMMRRSPQL